ncbi:MAG: hypothetical protein NT149_00790 [Candidatus Gottesmanbacteria bacterium]|nr:hypothetical protein [Candidatus Gottesmanbacteria bacterium]
MPKGNNKTTATVALTSLWEENYFKTRHNFKSISDLLEKRGNSFPPPELAKALQRASFLTRHGKRGMYEYNQRQPPIKKVVETIEQQLFADDLAQRLKKDFSTELDDLHLNFGRSGNCTSFLLRKILEKLIYIAFARNGLQSKLEDKNIPWRLVGLDAMVRIAASEKVKGLPFLTPKTAQEIRGIKFLGDTAAHNPIINVDMQSIIPQMPFIITAYKELARFL